MTNLLTVPQLKTHRDSETKHSNDDIPKNYAVVSSRRSIVFSTSTNDIAGADKKVAVDYVFTVRSGSLADVCEVNAAAARDHGRYDHERVFQTLKLLFRERGRPNENKWHRVSFALDVLAAQVITGL
jgi:WD repeat-containing protein 59